MDKLEVYVKFSTRTNFEATPIDLFKDRVYDPFNYNGYIEQVLFYEHKQEVANFLFNMDIKGLAYWFAITKYATIQFFPLPQSKLLHHSLNEPTQVKNNNVKI